MSTDTTLSAGFFVTRKSLTFFSRQLENVAELTLSPEIVVDLEIVSQASLERVMANWLEQLKIVPGQICLILHDSVYFNANLEQLPIDETDPAVKEFLEIVPFDEVLLKYFPLEKGAAAIAVNQGFLRPLISVLEKFGFVVVCVAPDFVLSTDFSQTPFSKEIAIETLTKTNLLLQYNLLSKAEVAAKQDEPQPFFSFKLNKQLIGLGLVFLTLIGILALLIYLQPK